MESNSNTSVFIFVALLLIFGIWFEVSLWNECRETNSFFYCLRILGK